MNDKIFISIASYRDPELLPTIRDCIKKAEKPENLVFCIAWQHNPEDDWDNLDLYKDDPRFKIIDINYKDSLGTCWARNLAQQKYDGEGFYMQLDSHHRFIKHWDKKCKNMLEQLQKDGHKKPLLTAYIPSYNPENDPQERVKEVWKLDFDRFTPEGVVFMLPALLSGWETKKKPTPTRFFSAHFVFTLGQFAKEVIYDPNLYFHGEEITLAVRSYTHGYDLFIPNEIVAWHEYTRKGRVRHWDENSEWEKLNNSSLLRCKKLLGIDNIENDIDFGEYGIGTERTIRDYEEYAGIRFADRSVQKFTLGLFDPPNPTYRTSQLYDNSFIHRFKHCVDVYKDSIPDEDWDAWVVSFEMEDGTVIHREDVYEEEMVRLKEQLKVGDWYNIWREMITDVIPDKCIVWPYKNDDTWGPRIEVNIPKIG